jgi:glucose/arabinose dehydrogenase
LTRRLITLAAVVGLVAASCSSGDDATPGEPSVPITTDVDTSTASTSPAPILAPTITSTNTLADQPEPVSPPPTDPPATESPAVTTTTLSTSARANITSVVSAEVTGRFDTPVGLAIRPNDDSLYVIEQPGRIVRMDGAEQTVAADIRNRVRSGGEQGLLGLAFSNTQSVAYVNYTDGSGSTVVSEFPLDEAGTFDTDAERILLTVDQPFSNHNGGELVIGPDQYLYIALGDGGSGNDPGRRASDPRSLLGSLLRIDPTPSEQRPYTIPSDNPFATGEFNGLAGAPEVWAWGLRNPWKVAFDLTTGDLWIADVGQRDVEEVSRVNAGDGPAGRGANFGWSAFEGNDRFNDDVADPGDTIKPIHTYAHGPDGCSISGGALYRGAAIVGLAPAFIYSDFCSGLLWALDAEIDGRNLVLLEGFRDVTAVRSGPNFELYVLERSGQIYLIS